MQIILNYKSYYDAFKLGVVESGFTPVAKLLFCPLLEDHTILDDTGTPIEADSQNSSKWGNGYIPIHKNIQRAAGTAEMLEKMISYFKASVYPTAISEALNDEMLDAMVELVNNCDLRPNKKNVLLKYYKNGELAEFLARVFQRALLGNNHVASPKNKISAADDNVDSIEEFNELVIKKKPKAVVPKNIRPEELGYVKQIFLAYEKTTGKSVKRRGDVKKVNYTDHFDLQRKLYYYAETIHREIRDSVKRDEDDCFDILKDEIELGINRVKNLTYDNPVDRMDAVTDRASNVVISHNTNESLYNWIGPGEKMGVCHMLVNDKRLQWVEEDTNEQESI